MEARGYSRFDIFRTATV